MSDRWKEFEKIVTERILTVEEVEEVRAMSELIEPSVEHTAIHEFWKVMICAPDKVVVGANFVLLKDKLVPEIIRITDPWVTSMLESEKLRKVQQKEADDSRAPEKCSVRRGLP